MDNIYQETMWIKEYYGSYRLLCFDNFEENGYTDYAAWEMALLEEDMRDILDDLRTGRREHFDQYLLDDYTANFTEAGTNDYDRLIREVDNGEWQSIEDFLAEKM